MSASATPCRRALSAISTSDRVPCRRPADADARLRTVLRPSLGQQDGTPRGNPPADPVRAPGYRYWRKLGLAQRRRQAEGRAEVVENRCDVPLPTVSLS